MNKTIPNFIEIIPFNSKILESADHFIAQKLNEDKSTATSEKIRIRSFSFILLNTFLTKTIIINTGAEAEAAFDSLLKSADDQELENNLNIILKKTLTEILSAYFSFINKQ